MTGLYLALLLLLNLLVVFSQVTHIPVILERGSFGSVNTNEINYYSVQPCPDSCADNGYATLSVSLPSNPTWISNYPLVTVELSTCQYTFDASCIFATNYIWSSQVFFPVITWSWPKNLDANGRFYIRVTAQTKAVSYTFDIQFSPISSDTTWEYNFNAFKQSTVASNTVFSQLGQYISLPETAQVQNYDLDMYFVKFCGEDFPSGCGCYNDFSVIVTVTATADKPMSMFNLFACAYNFPNSANCYNGNFQVANREAASVVQLTLNNTAVFNATEGIYIGVQGAGGESDWNNEYTANLKLYLHY
jgi:hypothetical protein